MEEIPFDITKKDYKINLNIWVKLLIRFLYVSASVVNLLNKL